MAQSAEYFERRERVERAAAKRAASPEARRVHQELAQRYAELATHRSSPEQDERCAAHSGLTIIAQSAS